MMERRRIGWLVLGMVGLLLATLVAVELPARVQRPTPARAQPMEIGGGLVPQGWEPEPPLPPPTPASDDDDPGSGDDDGNSASDGGTVTVVERHTIWRILFPYETLGASIRAALGDIVMEAAREVVAQARDGINGLVETVIGGGDFTAGIQNTRREVWRVGIVIAGILMPLSFMASVVGALKDGTSSVTGYASAREALLNWVIAAGAAVSSYFILSKGIELSGAATTAIFEGLLGRLSENFDLGNSIVGSLVDTGGYLLTPGIGQLFLAFFGILLAAGLLFSIGLALLAREVILILAVGIAPIMLILGSIGPLRWLHGLWMKVTTVALLLGPANAFLLGAGALLGMSAHQSVISLGGVAGRIMGYLVALGILSVLIGLNTLIGKMVYGAVIEIAEKAWRGVMAVVNLAGIAVGIAAAPAVGGLLGGAAASSSTAAGLGAGGAASTAGTMGTLAEASSGAQAASAMGRAIAASGLPGARGLAAGLNAGAAAEAHKQIKQGIANAADTRIGRNIAEPWASTELSMGKAISTASGGIHAELEASGPKAVLASSGISPVSAGQRVDAAKMTALNAMAAGDRHGANMLEGLRQLGVPGRVAQEAGVDYSRAAIRQMAFGTQSPFRPLPHNLLPRQITARDMDTAMQIVANARPPGMDDVPTVDFLDNLVQTTFHRRVQLNEDPQDTIRDAEKAANLDRWMRDSLNRLPNQGLAEGLRKRLGL